MSIESDIASWEWGAGRRRLAPPPPAERNHPELRALARVERRLAAVAVARAARDEVELAAAMRELDVAVSELHRAVGTTPRYEQDLVNLLDEIDWLRGEVES